MLFWLNLVDQIKLENLSLPNQADEIKLIKIKLNKLLLAIWMVGVEIQINANLAPN